MATTQTIRVDSRLRDAINSVTDKGIDQGALAAAIRTALGSASFVVAALPLSGGHTPGNLAPDIADALFVRTQVDGGFALSDAAHAAGLSLSRVQHLVNDGDWPSIKDQNNKRIVPRFAFGPDGGELPGIRRISRRAADVGWSVWSLARFMVSPNESLGMTPYEWAASGKDIAYLLYEMGDEG